MKYGAILKWEWWIYCKTCGHWAKGDTGKFHGWSCPKCSSVKTKCGFECYEEDD